MCMNVCVYLCNYLFEPLDIYLYKYNNVICLFSILLGECGKLFCVMKTVIVP